MATIDNLVLEQEAYVYNANLVKDLVLKRLIKDKIITLEQADIYSTDWQIIIIRKSWFKKLAERFVSKKETDWWYQFVKFED